ncbi:MAG: DUF2779 domain-containing protein [Nanoarchaeota archaeon]|nr:DUF2779 domain-containing protein [Nanoarchaeota archaeon]MBU1976656.1 DUF2779 domain-containing protein [Nanoarchaeota archaeon]
MTTLSKSAYIKGEQCQRLLWFANRKQLPEVSLADQHKFDQGHDFEKYVYLLFPKAIDLSGTRGEENINKTQEAIKKKKIIFEAGVQFEELFIRADIFEPVGNKWNLYEIKSTTEIKPQHIPDLAFQKYVLEKAGFKINKCFVLFLNKEYVKNGEIDAKQLVSKEDVTEQVELIDNIEENSQKYLETIKDECEPPITITVNCNKPYPCPLKEHCWGTLPENNVLHLTNWRQYWNFFHQGIIDIKDIPIETELNPKDEVIRKAVNKCQVVYSKEHLKHFMKTLRYPLYHFDFETFDTAVPIYDKSRPYQKIPFQYSLHIQQKDGKLEHFEYLADGKEDPRLKLLEQLKGEIEGKGSVVVFNKTFEISVLSKLAEDFPEHSEWINKVLGRIVDLAVPFQNFYYYCPTQKGSYSIKKVLPAITGKGYDNLEINNGGDASILYFNSHIKDKEEVKDKLRQDLLNYCGLDTEGMVWIVNELSKLIKN